MRRFTAKHMRIKIKKLKKKRNFQVCFPVCSSFLIYFCMYVALVIGHDIHQAEKSKRKRKKKKKKNKRQV